LGEQLGYELMASRLVQLWGEVAEQLEHGLMVERLAHGWVEQLAVG
jgi:hypothetical protein